MQRSSIFSGVIAGAAFLLAVAIVAGVLAAKVLAAETPAGDATPEVVVDISTAPDAAPEQAPQACGEGSTPRDAVFSFYLEEDPTWTLHSTWTGDKLVRFWGDMPPPPGALVARTVEAVIFQSPSDDLAVVVFFDAANCSLGHFGPTEARPLFARLGLGEA